MDHRRTTFFGTPLSKFLNDDSYKDDYHSRSSRRARLNKQETVHDDQGRQRFHGAFTGGFSAGYYNTVGSVQGFCPRSFVSHRSDKHHAGEKSSSTFFHKPEDYMDEEDFGEFGIAPKKIHVKGDFAYNLGSANSSGPHSVAPEHQLKFATSSLGERILRCMSKKKLAKDDVIAKSIRQKNDFHGLGYISLGSKIFKNRETGQFINPLVAVLTDGKRLKISGSAFGSGVLDDDDDTVDIAQEYGYDDLADYDFERRPKNTKLIGNHRHSPIHDSLETSNPYQLKGFVPAKNLDALPLCDIKLVQYSSPQIEEDWILPVRSKPYIPPDDEISKDRQRISMQKFKQASSSLVGKFTTGSIKTLCDGAEKKSGLISYSSLKDIELKDLPRTDLVARDDKSEAQTAISRVLVEWRPCSLLCRHFQVPNPFPDNKFCGVRPNDLVTKLVNAQDKHDLSNTTHLDLAPLVLRRSIFNVSFDDLNTQPETLSSSTDEDEPQVLLGANVQKQDIEAHKLRDISDKESDISIIDLPKPEPELIVLSSSSRSLSSSEDDDLYGPPLPPSRKTLIDADRNLSQYSRSKPSKKRKKKIKRRKGHDN